MRRDLTEELESALVGQPALVSLGDQLRNLNVRLFLESPFRPIKNWLNGAWFEHPLHPALTDIPVGAWTIAMVLDLVSLVFGTPGLGEASGIATGIGAAGASGAIVTGLMDFTDTDPPEVTVGFTHGIVNILATLLFAGSFFWRWRDHWQVRRQHFLLSALGYLVVTFGAYLGGTLVYRQGVMVNRNAYRKGPNEFTPALALDELTPNHPRRVEVKGQPVLLVKEGDRIYALGAVCSHYGAPLEKGRLFDGCIECPWHYSVYALEDGRVMRGPTTAPIPSYETRINNGQIEVKVK